MASGCTSCRSCSVQPVVQAMPVKQALPTLSLSLLTSGPVGSDFDGVAWEASIGKRRALVPHPLKWAGMGRKGGLIRFRGL